MVRHISSKAVVFVLALGFIAACSQSPAQIKKYGELYYDDSTGKKPSEKHSEKIRKLKSYFEIEVQEGDTLYELAGKYNMPARVLVDYNSLKDPYLLNTGQAIKIPLARFYTVEEGDTLYAIAKRHKVEEDVLVSINRLPEPYTINVGERLRLPYKGETGSAFATKKSAKKNFAAAKPVKKRKTHIAAGNIPTPTYRPGVQTSESEQKKLAATRTIRDMSGPAPKNFLWPIRGKIISSFGPKAGGIQNDGVNLSAPAGSRVMAAADGVVVYAGEGLKGYGNMLIIKHNGGWLSSYAHNNEILVERGDYVKRGQAVALVGTSGRVTEPQLHFGLRKGRSPVNPVKYLKT